MSHVNQATYQNLAVMTPSLLNGNGLHQPNPLELGMMADMGWVLSVAAGGGNLVAGGGDPEGLVSSSGEIFPLEAEAVMSSLLAVRSAGAVTDFVSQQQQLPAKLTDSGSVITAQQGSSEKQIKQASTTLRVEQLERVISDKQVVKLAKHSAARILSDSGLNETVGLVIESGLPEVLLTLHDGASLDATVFNHSGICSLLEVKWEQGNQELVEARHDGLLLAANESDGSVPAAAAHMACGSEGARVSQFINNESLSAQISAPWNCVQAKPVATVWESGHAQAKCGGQSLAGNNIEKLLFLGVIVDAGSRRFSRTSSHLLN